MDLSSSYLLRSIKYCVWLIICSAVVESSPLTAEPALLIVSYDAFRPEYFRRGVTPHMNQFRKEGTSAEFAMNVFPTKTFVNHHTIATGFYPQSHGILGNTLYDEEVGPLGYSYQLFHYNETILPIWTANEKAGKHSGCMMWPGSNFKYGNVSCTFSMPFNNSVLFDERVDTVMSWFTDKKTPANLVMLYFEEPDGRGHVYGPESQVITNVVAKMDNITKYIQDKLIEYRLEKRVNVVHLSDHGMNSVSPPNFIDLTTFLMNGTYEFYGSSPVLQVVPTEKKWEHEIYVNLTKGAKKNGHFSVFNVTNLPKRLMATNERRFGPIIAMADIEYAFQDMFQSAEYYRKKYGVPILPTTKYGVHGYDNQEESMHAIFMAKGPLIAANKTLKSLNTVDLSNLFCHILKIKCQKNDGNTNMGVWKEMLRPTRGRHPNGKLHELVEALNDRFNFFDNNSQHSDVILLLAAIFLISLTIIVVGVIIFFRNVFSKRLKLKTDKLFVHSDSNDAEDKLLLDSEDSNVM